MKLTRLNNKKTEIKEKATKMAILIAMYKNTGFPDLSTLNLISSMILLFIIIEISGFITPNFNQYKTN